MSKWVEVNRSSDYVEYEYYGADGKELLLFHNSPTRRKIMRELYPYEFDMAIGLDWKECIPIPEARTLEEAKAAALAIWQMSRSQSGG